MLWKPLRFVSVVVALAAAPALTAPAQAGQVTPASIGGTGALVAEAAKILNAKTGDGVLEQVHRRGPRHWHGPRWRPRGPRHRGPRWYHGPRHRWYYPGPRYRGWRDRDHWDHDRGGRRRGD